MSATKVEAAALAAAITVRVSNLLAYFRFDSAKQDPGNYTSALTAFHDDLECAFVALLKGAPNTLPPTDVASVAPSASSPAPVAPVAPSATSLTLVDHLLASEERTREVMCQNTALSVRLAEAVATIERLRRDIPTPAPPPLESAR